MFVRQYIMSVFNYFVTVFGMLLGDTIILDNLDDANTYRQEVCIIVILSCNIDLTLLCNGEGIGFDNNMEIQCRSLSELSEKENKCLNFDICLLVCDTVSIILWKLW